MEKSSRENNKNFHCHVVVYFCSRGIRKLSFGKSGELIKHLKMLSKPDYLVVEL